MTEERLTALSKPSRNPKNRARNALVRLHEDRQMRGEHDSKAPNAWPQAKPWIRIRHGVEL